jgi:pimeloyl-ACP methyl ester carboxylesterase
MPTLPSNGIQLEYEVRGDAAAPPVLLIMGLGMPAAMWPDEFVQSLLAQGFRVILFDNRDSGGSTRLADAAVPNVPMAIARALLRRKVRSPYTLDDMATDTAGLLDALGIDRAHVVGVSMGGMIGQVLAARHPQRVLSLTSVMSSTGNPQRKIAFGKRSALRAILHPPPPSDDIPATVAHLERVFAAIGSPGFPQDPAALRQHFEKVARRGLYRAGTARQLLAILGSGDRRGMLSNITAPTFIVHGGDDPLVPLAAGLDTARCIPGARLEVIMGMGHDFPPALMTSVAAKIGEHCRAASVAPRYPGN